MIVNDQPSQQLSADLIYREPPPRRPYALINLGMLVLALCWLALVAATLTPALDDFRQYWQASVNLLQSGDPYATTPEPNSTDQVSGTPPTTITVYPYPPLLAYLIQPLGRLDHRQGQWVWFGMNCIALGGLIWLCIRLSGSALARRYWGMVVLGTLLAPPTRLSLQLGQVSILLALLIVGGFAARRRSPPFAGALLALAALIKLYPALLGLFYAFRRLRPVVLWGMAIGLSIFALSVLAYGIAPYTSYLRKELLSGAYPFAAEFNISVVGFWDRLLSASNYAQPLAEWPRLARLIAAVLGLGALGVCFGGERNPADGHSELLQLSVWLCGMLLLSPVNGYYNLVLLLLPLLSVVRYLEQHPDRRTRGWLVVGTALVCIPPGWTNFYPDLYERLHRGFGLLLLTPAIYGLLIYLGLLALLVRRSTIERWSQ